MLQETCTEYCTATSNSTAKHEHERLQTDNLHAYMSVLFVSSSDLRSELGGVSNGQIFEWFQLS